MNQKAECPFGGYKNCPYPEEKRKYSLWSLFLVLYGSSSTPKSIDLECRKCGLKIALTQEEIKDRT